VGVGRSIDRPLEITGLGRHFSIFASVQDALRHKAGA
jgi:hypothetical protein